MTCGLGTGTDESYMGPGTDASLSKCLLLKPGLATPLSPSVQWPLLSKVNTRAESSLHDRFGKPLKCPNRIDPQWMPARDPPPRRAGGAGPPRPANRGPGPPEPRLLDPSPAKICAASWRTRAWLRCACGWVGDTRRLKLQDFTVKILASRGGY